MEINHIQAGRLVDAKVAQLLGFKAYKEQRGQYCLAAKQKPQESEPWKRYRCEHQEREKERYTEISCIEAVQLGFFGTGFPEFSTDIAAAYEMEGVIPKEKQSEYASVLLRVIAMYNSDAETRKISDLNYGIAHATPLQRCRAILKTLIA